MHYLLPSSPLDFLAAGSTALATGTALYAIEDGNILGTWTAVVVAAGGIISPILMKWFDDRRSEREAALDRMRLGSQIEMANLKVDVAEARLATALLRVERVEADSKNRQDQIDSLRTKTNMIHENVVSNRAESAAAIKAVADSGPQVIIKLDAVAETPAPAPAPPESAS